MDPGWMSVDSMVFPAGVALVGFHGTITLMIYCAELLPVQELINNLGGRMTGRSGDPREREFLFQRLGIAVQRGNSAALHGTFEQWTSEGL